MSQRKCLHFFWSFALTRFPSGAQRKPCRKEIEGVSPFVGQLTAEEILCEGEGSLQSQKLEISGKVTFTRSPSGAQRSTCRNECEGVSALAGQLPAKEILCKERDLRSHKTLGFGKGFCFKNVKSLF